MSSTLLSRATWAQTIVQFSSDPTDVPTGAYAVGPFPSNVLTVPDGTQATGQRVNLPGSEASCGIAASAVCSNTALLNQLDGFSVNPRLMVCFSSAVDPATLGAGMAFVPLAGGAAVSVNQIIFDPAGNCAFGKPNSVLQQASSYLLVVSNAVHDAAGKPVAASPAFLSCTGGGSGAYCGALAAALKGKSAPGGGTVVAASLFTTMKATAWLEAGRRFADSLPPIAVPAGLPYTFAVSKLKAITWVPDHGGIPPQNIPLRALSNVDAVSFGLYLSPNYLKAATIAGPPNAPVSYASVSYHVFLPAVKNKARIPVVIYGHGLGDCQFGAPTYMASILAKNGFATLAIELPGHGFGPAGIVNLTGTDNKVATVYTPGRGTRSATGGTIGATDGCVSLGAIAVRDCGRQAAIDLSVLVHDIAATGGLGLNLDASRIYYVGQSFGSSIGTLFDAVEPGVQTAVLNGDGGTSPDIARLAITGRLLGLAFLSSIGDPVLFNVAAGLAPPQEEYDKFPNYVSTEFNDNSVFRNQVPVTNTIIGAMAIQAAFEAADWLGMPGDPLAFAPHLKSLPLPGVPVKRTLFQFGMGDLEVPNPTESAVTRAAGGQGTAAFLHFETAAALQPGLAALEDPAMPGLPIMPHRVLSNPTIFTPGNEAELSLALAEQQQAADFFLTNGNSVTDPNKYLTAPFAPGDKLFEIPINVLPERLNFFQIPK